MKQNVELIGKPTNVGNGFIGKGCGALKLTIEPEPYSFERTLNWLRHQVAPTLKVAKMLDTLNKTGIVDELIR